MGGEPSVCGTHISTTCGWGSSGPRAPCTGGSPSPRSPASMAATGPPRRISAERRQALGDRGRGVARAARAAAAVEGAVAVVGLVHLGEQAHVDRRALLGDAAVEREQVAVALAAGDAQGRDELPRAVAVL